jgi:arylsulfatase A-like enzyme
MRSFGRFQEVSFGDLAEVALVLGAVVAITRSGRTLVERMRVTAVLCTAVGALSVLSIPFFSWKLEALRDAWNDPPAAMAPRPRPHIVLLTIDALSAEHMSLYGAPLPTTPELAAFAQSATTFERAHANANFTTPGIASILTGTRPWTHRALQLPVWPRESARRNSLPALLQRSGYQTGYVSTSPWAGGAKNGLDNYFDYASRDRVRGGPLCNDGLSSVLKYTCPAVEIPLFGEAQSHLETARASRDNLEFDPRLAIEPAIQWLRRVDKSKPVFLWLHLLPPHSPYAAPKPWLGHFDPSDDARLADDSEPDWQFLLGEIPKDRVRTFQARYDESVEYVDHYAGEFLRRALQILGDNTVIVITADHGESFAHGYGGHAGPGLYEELIHVPLIIRLPGQRGEVRSPVLAEQVDIAPTLAELAGVQPPSSWEGRSLLGTQPAKPIFSMNFEENARRSPLATGSIAVVEDHWKLVRYLGALRYPSMPPLHDVLYDLAADPGELIDRSAEEPAVVKRLSDMVAAELAERGGAVP